MHVLEQSRLKSSYSGFATIDEAIRQNERCRVKFHGVHWSAEAVIPFSLHPDDLVRVVGRKNAVLLIEPFSNQVMGDRKETDR
jgi:membrane protein implicated in regulation of membrane protease activity